MKRLFCGILFIVILIHCGACSDKQNSKVSVIEESKSTSQQALNETSEATYVPFETNRAKGIGDAFNFSCSNEQVYFLVPQEDGSNVLCTADKEFLNITEVAIDPIENAIISRYSVCDDGGLLVLWAFTSDSGGYAIQRLLPSMQESWCYKAGDISPNLSSGAFISGLAKYGRGGVLLAGPLMYFFSDDGKYLSECKVGNGYHSIFSNAKGMTYILVDGTDICPIENYAVGQCVFELELGSSIVSGDRTFDVYIINNSGFVGLDLVNSTQTDIFDFKQSPMYISINYIARRTDGNYIICGYDPIFENECILEMRQTAMDSLPETQEILLAVPLPEYYMDISDVLSHGFISLMSRFSIQHPGYTISYKTYANTLDLQKMLLSQEAPDIILFSANQMEGDLPSEWTLGQQGYLEDLGVLLDEDNNFSADIFLDSYMNSMKHDDGKLYSLSSGFFIRTMYGRSEYLGEDCGWTLDSFFKIPELMPDNMAIISSSQEGFLENVLSCNIDSFVNWNNLSCNFSDGRFSQLLSICKERVDGNMNILPGSVQNGDALLNYATIMKSLDDDIPASENLTCIGYPGVPGNGAILGTNDTMAICAQSDKKDVAWEVIKTMFSDEYQMNCLGPFYPVTKEAFNETLERIQCENEKKDVLLGLLNGMQYRTLSHDPIVSIALEEAETFFAGDKPADIVAEIVENRVKIYLAEQY